VIPPPEPKPDPSALALRIAAANATAAKLQQRTALLHSRNTLSGAQADGIEAAARSHQVLVWTALLGWAFVQCVASSVAMPEFPESLLLLMGISNGTYLGLKVPE
jgi:hypothetical protein